MKEDKFYLVHITEAIENILAYTRGVSKETFLKDQKLKDAVVRNIEIIGEAVKQVSSDLQQKHADIPWQKIARTRDMLIHHYFDVDDEQLWDIVATDIPTLQIEIEKIV